MGDFHEISPVASPLQAGLAALKRKDYEEAIATLETVRQSTSDAPTRARAEMGLVKAYVRTGEPEKAIALCQPLCDHANEQVRTWATQTLADFNIPANPPADLTGFVPMTKTLPQQRQVIKPARTTAARLSPEPEIDHLLNDLERQSSDALESPLETEAYIPLEPEEEITAIQAVTAWKQAGRAQKWTNLGKVDFSKLWGVQGLTAIAFLASVCALPWIAQGTLNWVLWQISWPIDLRPWGAFRADPSVLLIVLLLSLLAASPWILEALLTKTYHLKRLKWLDLERHSPESTRLLKRVCGQRQQPIPSLGVLPDRAPIAFTYGYLPTKAHIVVSQGLLDQLSDDEIATVYATELAHIVHWDFAVMSWLTLVAQLPYWAYWQVATWGDRQHDRVLQTLAVVGSSLAYGFYRWLRLPGLYLSRMRHYYSDRTATELTGNPNGLTRALMKMATGIRQDIQHQGYTSPLLESFSPLMPVGVNGTQSWEWDRSSAYRHWLAINNSHSPLGDRLHLLTLYAKHWKLESELDWNPKENISKGRKKSEFLLQAAPFLGIAVGVAIALCLWGLGWVADRSRWLGFTWLWMDQSVIIGLPLIGFAFGTFLRINSFFPDIKRSNLQTDLSQLLSNPAALPIDSQPVRLQGQLLGRKGFSNWLAQDLLLQTETELIRLHHTSNFGIFSDLMPQPLRPQKLMNETVTVTGWWRRGATPWIDVETIQAKRGTTIRSEHPVWSATLGAIAAIIGIYMIFKGGTF
jgi:Zn-dependent protease with chaperone function